MFEKETQGRKTCTYVTQVGMKPSYSGRTIQKRGKRPRQQRQQTAQRVTVTAENKYQTMGNSRRSWGCYFGQTHYRTEN